MGLDDINKNEDISLDLPQGKLDDVVRTHEKFTKNTTGDKQNAEEFLAEHGSAREKNNNKIITPEKGKKMRDKLDLNKQELEKGNLTNPFREMLTNEDLNFILEYLNKNKLSEKITNVRLGMNQLTTLPESFGKLINVTRLVLDNNNLQSLPSTFGKLQKLKYLDLAHNQLTTLPENFFKNLPKIIDLNLYGNNLKELPTNTGTNKRKDYINIDLSRNDLRQGNVRDLKTSYDNPNLNLRADY